MKRWLIATALLAAALPAFAGWQSRDSNYNQNIPVGASYTGPGDVVNGASAWWGLRCYNSAYTGNVADVYAPSDASHTLITCSTGGVLNETLQALSTTCATSCTVKTLYDQSGGTNCTGTACDLVQATESLRPAYTLNCSASIPCMTFAGSNRLSTAASANAGMVNPVTHLLMAKVTANFTSQHVFLIFRSTVNNLQHITSVNTWQSYGGASINATASDSACHTGVGVANGASSAFYIDGSSVTGSGGTQNSTGIIDLGHFNGGSFLTGTIREAGIWGSKAFTATEAGNLNTNMSAFGGC